MSMPDDADNRFERHEEILRGLTTMLFKMDGYLAQQVVTNAQQSTINERLTSAIERLDVTQARIETLLARMLRHEDNGR